MLNVKLLTEVKERILRSPELFDMSSWTNHCGTGGCIAGWACIVAQASNTDSGTCQTAVNLLGLSDSDGAIPYGQLFYTEEWPQDLDEAYCEASDDDLHEAMASVAAERIDRFIAEYGPEHLTTP